MKKKISIVAVLSNIRSLYNVGSIFRTADAAGVDKIYLTGITPSPLDRFGSVRQQFAKVSLGAERTVPWGKSASTSGVLSKLKRDGYTVFAIEQSKKAIPYFSLKHAGIKKIALVCGSETRGLSPSALRRAHAILEIPMRGKMVKDPLHPKNCRGLRKGKESLNVGVAFGVIVYYIIYICR